MLNLVQHLTKSTSYETLKQVQGDKLAFYETSIIDIAFDFNLLISPFVFNF